MGSKHYTNSDNDNCNSKGSKTGDHRDIYYSPENDEVMELLPEISMPADFVRYISLLIVEVIEFGRNDGILEKWTEDFSLRQILNSKSRPINRPGGSRTSKSLKNISIQIEKTNRCMYQAMTTLHFSDNTNDIYSICFTQRGTTWMIYEFKSINMIIQTQKEQNLDNFHNAGTVRNNENSAGLDVSKLEDEQIAAEEFAAKMAKKVWNYEANSYIIEVPKWRNFDLEKRSKGKVNYDYKGIEEEIDRRLLLKSEGASYDKSIFDNKTVPNDDALGTIENSEDGESYRWIL
jgi:hypothetical protein